jgi:hypothetical protein
VESIWEKRDLPVLRALAEHFDALDAPRAGVDQLAKLTGMSEDEVQRALRDLWQANPPLINGTKVARRPYPVWVDGVTERGLRMVGHGRIRGSWRTDCWPGLNVRSRPNLTRNSVGACNGPSRRCAASARKCSSKWPRTSSPAPLRNAHSGLTRLLGPLGKGDISGSNIGPSGDVRHNDDTKYGQNMTKA